MSMIEGNILQALSRTYLDRQPWFKRASGGMPARGAVLEFAEVLREEPSSLARLVLSCGERRFGLFVGWRSPDAAVRMLHGREDAIFGSATIGDTPVFVYAALADDELAVKLLGAATKGRLSATRIRRLVTFPSHASLVYDDKVLVKYYGISGRGTRQEIELSQRLASVGFSAMLSPIASWRINDVDLAFVREFFPSALEGRLLASTSLTDLFARASRYDMHSAVAGDKSKFNPDAIAALSSGDIAPEMRRLGTMVANLHLALAGAFEALPLDSAKLINLLSFPDGDVSRASLLKSLHALDRGEAGATIRLHGDLCLRRVMRSETGWIVAGLGDDALYVDRGIVTSLPARYGSPVEDLADMWVSIRNVASEAVIHRPFVESENVSRLAAAWIRRNQDAFLLGYVETPGIETIVPTEILFPLVSALAIERCAGRQARIRPNNIRN